MEKTTSADVSSGRDTPFDRDLAIVARALRKAGFDELPSPQPAGLEYKRHRRLIFGSWKPFQSDYCLQTFLKESDRETYLLAYLSTTGKDQNMDRISFVRFIPKGKGVWDSFFERTITLESYKAGTSEEARHFADKYGSYHQNEKEYEELLANGVRFPSPPKPVRPESAFRLVPREIARIVWGS